MNMRKIRMIAMAAMAVVLAASLTVAFAAGGFQAVVTSNTMKVYEKTAPYAYLGTLPKGTEVTIVDYNSKAALINYDGKTGIAHINELEPVSSAPQTTDTLELTATEAPTEMATAQEIAGAKEVVTSRASRVYQHKTTSSRYVSINAGVKLNLVEVDGNVAKVERGGVIGYMPSSHLTELSEERPTDATTQATEQAEDSRIVQYDRTPVVTTTSTRVYSKPSTSSDSITIGKGSKLVLLAIKGNCAMVERDGKVGYIYKNAITRDTSSMEAETESPATTTETRTESSISETVFTGTNEQIIYRFLTSVMGYNTAATCGVMANIKYESDYKPTTGGDSGTSYGIIQWHAARKTRLINWCENNGYDYTSLKGQLYFLQYELKTYYPAVHNRLKAISNNEQGAYEAGYDFCYNYEAPSNRASRSVTRGNFAKNSLWTRYKV